MFEHALQNVRDGDVVGIDIHNDSNQNNRLIGLSFRWSYQLSEDMI